MHRLLGLLLILAALAAFIPARAGAEPGGAGGTGRAGKAKPPTQEHWYIVELNGQRAGHMHNLETRADGKVITTSSMEMAIKRGAMEVRIAIASEFIETDAGKPVSMSYSRTLGAIPQLTVTRWTDKGLEITESQNGRETTRTEPADNDPWLTPAAADRYVEAELAKGSKLIVTRVIEPTTGVRPVTITRTILDRTNIDVVGRTVPAVKWESEVSIQPGIKSVEFVGLDGRALQTDINLGGIVLRTVLADKDLALAKQNAPELLLSTLVTPDKPIDAPRKARRATYRLSVADGELPDLPATATQSCQRVDAKTLRVTIDADARPAAPKADSTDPAFSAASAMINSDDPEIRKLLPGAAPDHGMPELTPEHLRHFAHRYIKTKDFSVGFASASEVARTKTGDCTEHGVFLAALLRAKGIPSRVVSGLIYVVDSGGKGIFGYHMWTQALVTIKGEPRWIDLDATLPNDTPYDATHITLAVTPLTDDDQQNFLVALAPLIGRLKIQVEKVE